MKPLATLALLAFTPCAHAQIPAVPPTADCTMCAEWNQPHDPVKLYGNAYWVGTDGLGAILVTGPEGHVLIDGALPESAPLIVHNIEALGFRLADVKLILNSHAHFDHAGGIALLQRLTGAEVAASPPGARDLRAGNSGADDPQYGQLLPFPRVEVVREIADGDTLRVGPLKLVAHFTPGHTAGGTTWTWRSCEADRCLGLVYADSMTPVSADGYRFTDHPDVRASFEQGYAVLEGLSCDLLVTPHPGASRFWERMSGGVEAGNPYVGPAACEAYRSAAARLLARRLQDESSPD